MSKILLVDDSLTDRILTKRILQTRGYEIIESDQGEGISEIIEKESPDLVLLDIIMPGPNGYEVCRKIKSSDLSQSIPILFVSCKTQPSDIYWGKLQGADGYLTKPYEPAELLDEVDKFLSKNQGSVLHG